MPATDINVFISYSHDSPEHDDRVRALSDLLRADGINCVLDQYEVPPPEGWPRWTENQIRAADFVLMICTETYYRRVMGEEKPGTGLGVRWEGHVIYQHIYNAGVVNAKFIPVLLESGMPEHIPAPLRAVTYYDASTKEGYESLYRRLTNQPETPAMALGKRRPLAPRQRATAQAPAQPPAQLTPNIVHPYPLQANFTGRKGERGELTGWLYEDERAVCALVGMGGMGKSALAWYWLTQDVLRAEQTSSDYSLAGVMWWSFYEQPSFARFVDEALRYVSEQPAIDADRFPTTDDRAEELLRQLQNRRVLFVLDGLEQQLRAYAVRDAAREQAGTTDTPGRERTLFDSIAARWLVNIAAGATRAKVLLATRLMISDLEHTAGVLQLELGELRPEEAVAFMRAQGVKGEEAEIAEVARAYGNHPLSLRLLSGLIARDKQAPGDIAAASRYETHGDPIQRRGHILDRIYNELPEAESSLLSRIALFSRPVSYDALTIFNDFGGAAKFDAVLDGLSKRGLLQHDLAGNRYDLHPIVRRYAYDRLADKAEAEARVRDYFARASASAGRRVPIAGFLTDSWQGEDLLDITADVNAMASLIAAWSVEPPLSIGLFGNWGSGKTHFMRQLKARVEKLSRKARASREPQNKLGYYKYIVQIEFNAWHYIEGNLWASLVEHIFQNLRMYEKEDDRIVEKRQEEWLRQLLGEERAQKEAEAAVEVAKQKVEDKEGEIREIEKQQQERIEKLRKLTREDALASVWLSIQLDPSTRDDVNEALREIGINQAGQAARELQAALAEARTVLGRGSSVLTPMLKALDGKKRFAMLVLILVGAPAVGILLALGMKWLAPQISNLSGILGGLTTLMTAGAFWVRKQAAWMSHWLQRVEEIKQKVDKRIDEQTAREQARNAAEMAAHEQELKVLQTKLEAALRERDAAQRRVDEIRAAIKQNSVVYRLGTFIQDRAASDDYRKHLGVLALIRRDFEKLASLFGERREEERQGKVASAEDDEKAINRIILYIDDLDRCPPERVVLVLQAIHLLLAFPLFVVVVGVDARWVTRSLQESYEWLRAEEGNQLQDGTEAGSKVQGATPHDYLEKIFQIPFWLKPMADEACRNLLEGLTKDSRDGADGARNQGGSLESEGGLEIADAGIDKSGSAAAANVRPPVDSNASDAGTGAASGMMDAGSAGNVLDADGVDADSGGGAGEVGVGEEEIDLEPQSLKLTDAEIEYMKALTPLVGRSPRAVKRFLNCYRLIKVRSGRLEDFIGGDGQGGEYRAVMILLGVITGAPSVSAYFIEELETRSKYRKANSLHDLLAKLDADGEVSAEPDWPRVKDFLEGHLDLSDSARMLATLIAVTPRVSRYSFRVARVEPSLREKPGLGKEKAETRRQKLQAKL